MMFTIERALTRFGGFHAASRGTTHPRLLGNAHARTRTDRRELVDDSYVVSASLGLSRQIPFVGSAILGFVPFVLTCAAFTLLYYVVPNRAVRPHHALIVRRRRQDSRSRS